MTATFLITTICGITIFVCFFVCCCCLRDRPHKHNKLRLSPEFYPDNKTDSLRSVQRKELAPSPSLSPSVIEGDFSRPIAPSDFKERVNELWEQEYDQLIEEYNSLGGAEMRYPAETAVRPGETAKNRYKNILPYDRSRVVLRGTTGGEGTGYINASHIPGILIPQRFICSQGPKENTVNDFWLMLWENEVRHLVMVTKLVERGKKKCECYWPQRVGDGERRGDLFVTLVNLVTEDMWTIREMMVRNAAGEKRVVKQMQFTGWPDFEAPKHPRDLILFLQRVKLEVAEDTSVICVHCSAGVGRTGTFIALYNLMEQVGDGSSFSIWHVVNEMREYRPQMVQAWSQYRFMYLAVLELMQGDTCVQVNNFPHYVQFRLQTHSPIFTTQFHELDYQAEKTYTRLIERAFDVDAVNPDTMVLPYDDTRVVLSDTFWDGTDYINASYIEGISGAREFIATQLPVSESVRDMMQLVYQTKSAVVVLLASYLEFDEMSYDEGRIRYWPVPMTQHEFSGYTLMNENTFIHPLFNKLRLIHAEQEKPHEFTLVTLLDWTKEGEFGTTPDCLQRLFQVTQLIERCQEEEPSRPIIIQCKDGSGATGVLIAALNSIGQIKSGGNLDIFQIAKRMRSCRQCMISSLVSCIPYDNTVTKERCTC